jgi:hypothetical protein
MIHGVITLLQHYFLIYALRPMMTGFPSIITSVSLFPWVLATTSVFPDALGVGVSRSAVMMSLFPSIFAVTATIFPPLVRRADCPHEGRRRLGSRSPTLT